jgi:hypothetical protein
MYLKDIFRYSVVDDDANKANPWQNYYVGGFLKKNSKDNTAYCR